MDLDRGVTTIGGFSSEKFARYLKDHSKSVMIADLSIASDGPFETFYAPFDHINTKARVTIVGLTPGQEQMNIALNETRRLLRIGLSWSDAIERAKYAASFGGPMRANLVRMLDHVGMNKWLNLDSCASLFSNQRLLAHHTSVLRYPVFKNGKNYSGTPPIHRSPFLVSQVEKWFFDEVRSLPGSIFLPLGEQAQNVVRQLVLSNIISDQRALIGLPHPSGANAERVAYFLGRKSADSLSRQTNAEAIDRDRENLIGKIQKL